MNTPSYYQYMIYLHGCDLHVICLQKCHRVNVYGFFLNEAHGVRYHYYDDVSRPPADASSLEVDTLDREFVEAVELADSEMLWIADPCLYGERGPWAMVG